MKKESILEVFARKAAFADALLGLVKDHGLLKKRRGRKPGRKPKAEGAVAKTPKKRASKKAAPAPVEVE